MTRCSTSPPPPAPRARLRPQPRPSPLSRTRPPVGADLDAGEVPGEAGVGRPLLPVAPHPEAREPWRDYAEGVARRIEGGERPMIIPRPAQAARLAIVLLEEGGIAEEQGATGVIDARVHLTV